MLCVKSIQLQAQDMKQVCTDSVILLVVCVLMQGVFRTEGLVSTLCSAAVPADCLSRTGGTVSLSSVVADHIAWDFDLDEPSGLYALRVNNSADCLEANTSISFAVCSTASHIWDVEAFSSSTDLTFSQGISGECSRLSSNVSADVGLVPCTEESVNTAWVVQGELLTSLVPSTSPTFQPTVPSPSGPKPFEPFSTPFR